MSVIMNRLTVTAEGTPDGLRKTMANLPEGVPGDASIVEVETRLFGDSSISSAMNRTTSYLALTLEWPA